MLDQLKAAMAFMEQLNEKNGFVDRGEIEEQYENLQDLEKLTDEFQALLDSLKTIDMDNGDEVQDKLFELYRIMTAYEWHFSEISDLSMSIFKQYQDSTDDEEENQGTSHE